MLSRSLVSDRFATFDAFFAHGDQFPALPDADRAWRSQGEGIANSGWSEPPASFRGDETALASASTSNGFVNAPGQEPNEDDGEWESDWDSDWETEWESADLHNRETFFFISQGRLHRVTVWSASEWAAQAQGRHGAAEAFETSRGNFATVHAL